MEAFVLKPHEIPPTLYRAQCATYYIPPCAAMEKGIHALNSKPEALLSQKQLIEAVDNHLRLAEPLRGPIQSQWPTPFLSVFSQPGDAEEALNGCNKYSGCGNWRIIEVSGAVVSARGVKVLRLRDVKGSTAPFEENGVTEKKPSGERFTAKEDFTRVLLNRCDPAGDITDTDSEESDDNNVEDSHDAEGESQLPEGFHKIEAVLDHWPAKAGIENAKYYQVRWEGTCEDEWLETEDVTETAIEIYWEHKAEQKKKRRHSKAKKN